MKAMFNSFFNVFFFLKLNTIYPSPPKVEKRTSIPLNNKDYF